MFPLELPITRVPLVVTFSSSAEEFSVLVTGTDKSVMTLAVTLLKTSRLVVTTDVDVIDFSVFICSVLVVSFPVVLVIVLLLDSFVLVVGAVVFGFFRLRLFLLTLISTGEHCLLHISEIEDFGLCRTFLWFQLW